MKLNYSHLANEISSEILRVSAKRERTMRAARGAGTVNPQRPMIYVMDQAMYFARKAREGGEVAHMAVALRALKDIRE